MADAYNGWGRAESGLLEYTSLGDDDFVRIVKAGKSSLIAYDNLLAQMSLPTLSAANTVQVNSVDDFPTASGGVITLLGATRYVINASINIGTNKLLMAAGTAIEGWAAQRSQIISSNAITIDTTSGAFNTCILKGPLRIQNDANAGKCVNVAQGVFLIYDGCLTVGNNTANTVGINIEANAAAVSINNHSAISQYYGIKGSGAISFGATIKSFNSSALPGKGIAFEGTAGTTNFGTVSLVDCISSGVDDAFRMVGKSSSITMQGCRFASTSGDGLFISNTSGNRIDNMNISNTSLSGIDGMDISSGFFGTLTMSAGQCAAISGFAIRGQVEANSPFSTGAAFAAVSLSNSGTPTNILSGITKKDTPVSFQSCKSVADSVVAGALRITTPTAFTSALSNAPLSNASIFANTALTPIAERTSKQGSAASTRLRYDGQNPVSCSLHWTLGFVTSSGTTNTHTFQVYLTAGAGSLNSTGLVAGSSAVVTTSSTIETWPVSMSIPITLYTGDEIELYCISTVASHTLTFSTYSLALT